MCFQSGNLVLMGNGERKKIEDIVEEDQVMVFGEIGENMNYKLFHP